MMLTNERNSNPHNYSLICRHIENKQRNTPTLTFVFMNGQRTLRRGRDEVIFGVRRPS